MLFRNDNLQYCKMAAALALKSTTAQSGLSGQLSICYGDSRAGLKSFLALTKKFNLDGSDGFAFYWHDTRKEKQVFSKRQGREGSVMVWGAFCEKGVSDLAIITGNRNALQYTNTLENYLLPFAKGTFQTNCIFQQHNATVHTARITKVQLSENTVDVLPWPAKSLDLNPIENIWRVLARVIYADERQFSNFLELKGCVLKK